MVGSVQGDFGLDQIIPRSIQTRFDCPLFSLGGVSLFLKINLCIAGSDSFYTGLILSSPNMLDR